MNRHSSILSELLNPNQLTIFSRLDFWSRTLLFMVCFPISAFVISGNYIWILLALIAILTLSCGINISRKILLVVLIFGGPLVVFVTIVSIMTSCQGTYKGIFNSFQPSVRFLVLIGAGALFTFSSSPWEIPDALSRIKAPHRFSVIMLIALRMFSLLRVKIRHIMESQMSRGAIFNASPKYWLQTIKCLPALIIPIVVSTLNLSVAFADSLLARGFNPNAKIASQPWKWYLTDWITAIISVTILCVAVAI